MFINAIYIYILIAARPVKTMAGGRGRWDGKTMAGAYTQALLALYREGSVWVACLVDVGDLPLMVRCGLAAAGDGLLHLFCRVLFYHAPFCRVWPFDSCPFLPFM